jgi:hypothetical protein
MGCEGIGAEALHKAPVAFADDGFGVDGPLRNREETLVHGEGRAGAAGAVGVRRVHDEGSVEVERLTGNEAGEAVGDDLVAEPFALAEVRPVVAPVGSELRGGPGAFEFGDLVEDRGDNSKQGVERPEPCGLAFCACVVIVRDRHGRDYTAARTPAGFENADPTNFRSKCLKSGWF